MGSRGLINYFKYQSINNNIQGSIIDKLIIDSIVLVSPETDLSIFLEQFAFIRSHVNIITIYGDMYDQALFWAELFNRKSLMTENPSLGKAVNEPLIDKDTKEQIDADFINSSTVSSNVSEIRHSYFSLSREVIEDIRELIVFRNRAKNRIARLCKRKNSNIFDFLVAPKYISDK